MFYRSTLTRSRVHTLTHTQHACTHTHTTHHTQARTHTHKAVTNICPAVRPEKPSARHKVHHSWLQPLLSAAFLSFSASLIPSIQFRCTIHCYVCYIACTQGIIYFETGSSICLVNSNRTATEHFRSRQNFSYEPYEKVLISP